MGQLHPEHPYAPLVAQLMGTAPPIIVPCLKHFYEGLEHATCDDCREMVDTFFAKTAVCEAEQILADAEGGVS